LRLINLEVTPDEKKSIRPPRFVSLMPNAMARLALAQLKRLDYFNSRRRQSAEFYFHNLKIKGAPDPAKFPGAIFLRYPLQVKNPREVIARAKKAGIILGDWYSTPVAPCDIERSKTGYRPGSCPRCEQANARMVNLPTHHSLTAGDRRRIVQIINEHAES
jgi:dTDP-4-amino-4,6-dideoxygalactose transaminase